MRTLTPNINRILRSDPRNCSRGAPMGAANFDDRPVDTHAADPLLLQEVSLHDGGCYAADGTYWGWGMALWCAFNRESSEFAPAMGTRLYSRAKSREDAKAELLRLYPTITFAR